MQLVDTHTHLFSEEFSEDRKETIQRALTAGVDMLMLPNIDASTLDATLALEKEFPGKCFAMLGLHPCHVKENFADELKQIHDRIKAAVPRAIGEIGIDLYWDKTFAEQQKEALRIQFDWALELDLPVVLHTRESFRETVQVVDEVNALGKGKLRGIFHCFTGDAAEAQMAVDRGFMLGIGGVVTFKNSLLPQVLKDVPRHAVVLETDSPYLAPHPYRGKRNESAYLLLVARKLAEIWNLPLEEVAAITTENAKKIFSLP